eukprot:TRINITY_DN11332_c0_g1_i1.p1 TRINITY_DN11332_c0_g1~~TRINITY_DN11332_c0_g1_i1.p1  ORF type:complete len:213 (+),score=2.30 TRINITY_DN11332_c0_g1_i1:95-733(+)
MASTKTTLTLVRHGETDWNLEHRLQGHTDIPLNERGLKQAKAAGSGLVDTHFDATYASDLSRAFDTAVTICQAGGHPMPISDERLRERSLGVCETHVRGKPVPDHLGLWSHLKDPDYVIPDGESLRQFSKRVIERMQEIARQHPGQSVLVVAHGGVLTVLLHHILGIPLGHSRHFAITNASINKVSWDPVHGWFLELWNDTRHLEKLGFIHL